MSDKKQFTAEELVEKLTREAPQGGEFSLSDAIIVGKLDLQHRIIPVAATLTNCTFTDEVDLRYCEFKQRVIFSGSCFKKDFNSGDETNSFTIYRKDFICNGSVFEGGASFYGAQCEGSGYFHRARFENLGKEIDFGHAKFGGNLECMGAIFKGGAIFNGLQCEGTGFFHNARFENPEREIDFIYATFSGNLDCVGSIFKGGAIFNGLQCKGIGSFRNVRFENPEKEISFVHAEFGVNLQCIEVIFKGGAIFNGLQCEGSGFFRNAQFKNPEKEIDFGNARFGGNLECQGAIFSGGVIFNGLQCEGNGFFHNAQFKNPKGEINFGYAIFGINLECQGEMIFAGKVDFQNIQISRKALFWETKFQKSVNFNSATIHSLSLMDPRTDYGSDSFPFEKKEIDLRRCKFDIFEGTKKQRTQMVAAQSPEKFSLDPYLQFEQYYQSIGDEAHAKKIYYEGRRALRKNALSGENSEISWSWWKRKSDWILCWTVGYGVKMWQAFILIFILLCAGAIIFCVNDPLIPKDAGGISARNPASEQTDKTTEVKKTDAKHNLFGHPGRSFLYSLDIFIPLVNLRIVDGYKRFHDWRAVYGVLHIVMGWILVPLLIASLSGVIKK